MEKAPVRAAPKGQVFVSAGELILDGPDGRKTVRLNGRTLGEVAMLVNTLPSSQWIARSSYPSYPAIALNSPETAYEVSTTELGLTASPNAPRVGLLVGAVMSLAEPRTDQSGILAQTGFQLDVVGTHQLVHRRTGEPETRFASMLGAVLGNPDVFVQMRFGLGSNQSTPAVETKSDPDAPEDAPPAAASNSRAMFAAVGDAPSANATSVLSQATTVALTGQFELVWPLTSGTGFSLTGLYGAGWAQLEPLSLPESLQVGGEPRSFKSQFDNVDRVTTALNRAMPTGHWELIGLLRFSHANTPVFYGGAGTGRREVLRRGFSFRRDENGTPVRSSLAPEARGDFEPFWRAVFGANVSGFADLRVDATGPIGNRRADPVFRVILGTSLPSGGK